MHSNCLSATTSPTSSLGVPAFPAAAFLSRKPFNHQHESADQDVSPFPKLLEALTSPFSSLTERVWASDLRAFKSRQDSKDALAQYLE